MIALIFGYTFGQPVQAGPPISLDLWGYTVYELTIDYMMKPIVTSCYLIANKES